MNFLFNIFDLVSRPTPTQTSPGTSKGKETQKGNGSGNAAIAGENLSSDLQLRRQLHNFVSSFR